MHSVIRVMTFLMCLPSPRGVFNIQLQAYTMGAYPEQNQTSVYVIHSVEILLFFYFFARKTVVESKMRDFDAFCGYFAQYFRLKLDFEAKILCKKAPKKRYFHAYIKL